MPDSEYSRSGQSSLRRSFRTRRNCRVVVKGDDGPVLFSPGTGTSWMGCGPSCSSPSRRVQLSPGKLIRLPSQRRSRSAHRSRENVSELRVGWTHHHVDLARVGPAPVGTPLAYLGSRDVESENGLTSHFNQKYKE